MEALLSHLKSRDASSLSLWQIVLSSGYEKTVKRKEKFWTISLFYAGQTHMSFIDCTLNMKLQCNLVLWMT